MPTAADGGAVLLDTSAAVALAVAAHTEHRAVVAAVRGRRLGLAGHAWVETFSVLTRLPPPARRRPGEVARLLAHDFPDSRFLDVEDQRSLTGRLVRAGIAGGAVYDALVGAVAHRHRLPLLTLDRRATATYRALDVAVEVL